jgi:hypothetical protein
MSELFWVNFLHQYAIGLSVGASTFAMVFYYYVLARGETHPEHRKLMHIVYFVLRIGMLLIVISEFAKFAYSYQTNNYLYWMHNPEVFMRWLIFSIIVLNAILMHKRLISMWIGPVLAGGSWYALFFFSVFVDIRWVDTGYDFIHLLVGYLLWLLVVFAVLGLLRLYLTRRVQKPKLV